MADQPPSLREAFEADPVAALRELKKLQQYVVYPHDGQKQVLGALERFLVLNAGRRWGKTKVGAKKALTVAREGDKMVWWVAPTYKIVKRGYREVLRQLPRNALARPAPPDTNFDAGRSVILHFKNGTNMEFYSATQPEGMLGEGVDFVIMDEAAIMTSRIWEQIVSPTLMDREGGALFISTPRGRNWFWRSWQKGQDKKNKLWKSWTFPSNTNPYLPPDEFERMKEDLPRVKFLQEVMAEFIAEGSSVFFIPDEAVQTNEIFDSGFVDGTPPAGHVVMGIDLAKTEDYTVLYAARAKDRRNCFYRRFHEVKWPQQKRIIRRAIQSILRKGATSVSLVIDSTGVGDPIFEDLEELGYDIIGINFSGTKNNMVTLLAKDIEECRAFVLDNEERSEFDNYLMSITPGGRYTYSAPEGEHDDAVSAKMLQHWGLVNEGVPESMVISAESPVRIEEDSEFDVDEYDDLFDDDDEITVAEEESMAMNSIGIQRPTTAELLLRPEVWESFR